MTIDELKEAWRTDVPVIHGGIEYVRVSALIYRRTKNKEVIVQAELLDRNQNSVTIAAPKDIKIKEAN